MIRDFKSMSYFGMILQQRLYNLNKSHEWLAKQVGCTRYYISGIISGTFKPPDPEILFKMCKVLDLNYFQMGIISGKKIPKYLYQSIGLDFEELEFVVSKWKELGPEDRDKILNFMWKRVDTKEYEKTEDKGKEGKGKAKPKFAIRLKKSYLKLRFSGK